MISVVIVSWNVRDLLKKCLESIFRYSKNIDFEIIVVDNASSDQTIEMIKQDFSQVKVITNNKNLGFAKANNQGIRQARGEYILLLNPDTEFIEDSLGKVMERMRGCEGVSVLGCRLLNTDGTLQPSVRRFPRVRDVLIILFKLHKLFPSLLDHYLAHDLKLTSSRPHVLTTPLQKVDQIMGAFFLVPSSVFKKVGLLDEKYFIWFEEVDFCRRVGQNGLKVIYWPGTSVVHHGAQSFAQQMTWRKQWWFFKSSVRFFLKRQGRR